MFGKLVFDNGDFFFSFLRHGLVFAVFFQHDFEFCQRFVNIGLVAFRA